MILEKQGNVPESNFWQPRVRTSWESCTYGVWCLVCRRPWICGILAYLVVWMGLLLTYKSFRDYNFEDTCDDFLSVLVLLIENHHTVSLSLIVRKFERPHWCRYWSVGFDYTDSVHKVHNCTHIAVESCVYHRILLGCYSQGVFHVFCSDCMIS